MSRQIVQMTAFNTGRMYTQYGQRIHAKQYDDGTVDFYDLDREIWYRIKANYNSFEFRELEVFIMYHYDRVGHCQMISPNEFGSFPEVRPEDYNMLRL